MVDLATVTAGLKQLRTLYEILCKRQGEATRRLLEARNEESFAWAADLALRDRERLEALQSQAAKIADLEEKLAALVADPQFFRVRTNYCFEAAREAIDERRRMLAYAAAGSLAPGLTVGQIARVERTIRELDPDDVKFLKLLSEYGDDGSRYSGWQENDESGHVLLAAGCVDKQTTVDAGTFVFAAGTRLPSGERSLLSITPLGLRVLHILDLYLRVETVALPAGHGEAQ